MEGLIQALGLAAFAGVAWLALRARRPPSKALAYAEDLQRYRVWLRSGGDPEWRRVVALVPDALRLEDGTLVPSREVERYVATYRSGVVVAAEPFSPGDLPPGAAFPDSEAEPVEHRLERGDLRDGRVRVEFARSRIEPRDRRKYSTRLTNTADARIRVLRFGAYRRLGDGGYELSTISGGFFSAADFREWYAVADAEGWIPPGSSVVDPDNYGGPQALWAYEVELESGERAWVGGVGP